MFDAHYEEHRDFHYSTDSEWDHAEAMELGAQSPNQAWVLTDRDVWHANPFYKGAPVPHPDSQEWEQYGYDPEEYDNIFHHAMDVSPQDITNDPRDVDFDDDIPF